MLKLIRSTVIAAALLAGGLAAAPSASACRVVPCGRTYASSTPACRAAWARRHGAFPRNVPPHVPGTPVLFWL